jgi:acetyl-CoA carboxylase carboxyltransferase component
MIGKEDRLVGKIEPLKKWEEKRLELLQGDEAKIKLQHDKGKKTARERIAAFFDAASFVELGALKEESGVICGYGLSSERPVYAVAQDITVKGAAMSKKQADKIINTLSLAKKTGAPVVFFTDTEGFSVKEDALTLKAFGEVFAAISKLSVICPIITLVAGECCGIAAQFAMLSDISIAIEGVTVIMPFTPAVMGKAGDVNKDGKALGGAKVAAKQGSCALTAKDEDEAIAKLKTLLALLPSSVDNKAPFVDSDDINRVLSADGKDGFKLVTEIADNGTAIELYPEYGAGMYTFLARIGGYSCALIASEPGKEAGRLNSKSCKKVARVLRLADKYNLPVVNLIASDGLDVPAEENQGELMISCGKMMRAYALAQVPKISVVYGNAIGASYVASVACAGSDLSFVWPNAMVASLTKELAVLAFEADKIAEEGKEALEEAYAKTNNGVAIAKLGLADEVIYPSETRKHVIAALELLYTKR